MLRVDDSVAPNTLTRLRLLLGALLLFAAVLTWFIGFTLSPHGKAVVAGTEHVRDTVVTFKRNGAIGTLILSAVSTWLLFPVVRTRRYLLDWALILVMGLLVGSSIYTLLSLRHSLANSGEFDQNLATGYGNEANTNGIIPNVQSANTSEAFAPLPVQGPTHGASADDVGVSSERMTSPDRLQWSDPKGSEQQANTVDEVSPSADQRSATDGVEQNQ